jgi:hypothetical protein
MEGSYTRAELVRRGLLTGGAVLAGGLSPLRLRGAGEASAATALPETHRFRSRPDLVPPVLTTVHHDVRASAGCLFLAPLSGPGARGPLLLDGLGEPVWFRPSLPVVALNFRPAVYHGKPVLTWWEGKTEHGLGRGTHVIVDDAYREIARIPAGNKRPSDLHEFIITPHGTALVTAWEAVRMDLRRIGGLSNAVVIGGVVQELELPGGRVLFEWRSLDHVTIDESYTGISTRAAYDYFHVNSIDLDADGNLLVSARNTWTVYKIDRGTGKVIWRLGGKKSDFRMGPGTVFAWQHDARHHHASDHLISVFDDGSAPRVQPQSKALVLALDTRRRHVTLRGVYKHTPSVRAHALGSTQILPDGNVLVGWGTAPFLTEYTRAGTRVFEARLPYGSENYRALKSPWRGRPTEPPDALVLRRSGRQWLYVSWNGATDVHSWQLEAGHSLPTLAAVHAVRRTGFETQLLVPHGSRVARAVALDGRGKPIGRSFAVTV